MASESDRPKTEDTDQEPTGSEETLVVARSGNLQGSGSEGTGEEGTGEEGSGEEQLATQLGVQKYVHAAFFSAGILSAYLFGKVLLAAWNSLAEWPDAVRQLPLLLEYTEDERGSMTLVIGAVLGALLILRYYRRPSVRSWATDVAGELARVTWPSKDTVTNGTIVVLVAGAVATFYVAVLDRLWSYLTNLVYGT